MTSPPQDSQDRLGAPLDRLATLGLQRPPGFSAGRFLGALVEAGLLPAGPVEAYAAAHQQLRYGDGTTDEAATGAAVDGLLGAIEAIAGDATRLGAAADRIAAATAPADSGAGDETPAGAEAGADAKPDPQPAMGQAAQAAPDPPPPAPSSSRSSGPAGWMPAWARRSDVRLAAFLLWSVGLVALGYLVHDPVDAIVADAREQVNERFRHHRHSRDPVEHARQHVEQDPEDARAWRTLGEKAFGSKLYPEAIAAFERSLRLEPRNAAALNELAWLYCTADDPIHRDPQRGLVLAERAYAIDRSPHITDTLAEASYLSGDLQRALTLERDALSRVKRGKAFYEKQLARFEAALARQEAAAGP